MTLALEAIGLGKRYGRTWGLRDCSLSIPPGHDADTALIDTGLALYFPAPHSFTGEHVLELHGHGGPVVMEALVKRGLELGARMITACEARGTRFLWATA